MVGFVLLVTLPFINKAFHIDDRIYLEIAWNALQKPLFPYDYPPLFEGLETPDAASHSHLPLTSYYLALVWLLTGSEQEWVYHLAFLIFPVITIFSLYELSGRFVRHRLPVAILLIASPAFLVLSHTLMTDVPLLAFWLLATASLVRIVDKSGTEDPPSRCDYFLLTAGILGSAFISLISIGLVLLCLAYLWLEHRSGRKKLPIAALLSIILAPLLLWVLWYVRAYLYYDRFVLLNTFSHIQKRAAFDWTLMAVKALSFIVNVGGVILFPPLVWVAFRGAVLTRLMLFLVFLAMIPFYLGNFDWGFANILLFAIFFTSGLLVLLHFVRKCPVLFSAPLQGMLGLWLAGIFASCLLLYYAGSVRYILLALPPVILAWAAVLEKRATSLQTARYWLWGAVVLTLLYSLPVAWADYCFAGQYRDVARKLTARYAAPGRQIWLTGEWGFRYYLEKAGGKPLLRTNISARPGDFLMKPYIATPWVTVYDGSEYSRLVEQVPLKSDFPIRILDFSSHAGFYSTGWGILPFAWREQERWEWINVFEIVRPYEGEPPTPERHW